MKTTISMHCSDNKFNDTAFSGESELKNGVFAWNQSISTEKCLVSPR